MSCHLTCLTAGYHTHLLSLYVYFNKINSYLSAHEVTTGESQNEWQTDTFRIAPRVWLWLRPLVVVTRVSGFVECRLDDCVRRCYLTWAGCVPAPNPEIQFYLIIILKSVYQNPNIFSNIYITMKCKWRKKFKKWRGMGIPMESRWLVRSINWGWVGLRSVPLPCKQKQAEQTGKKNLQLVNWQLGVLPGCGSKKSVLSLKQNYKRLPMWRVFRGWVSYIPHPPVSGSLHKVESTWLPMPNLTVNRPQASMEWKRSWPSIRFSWNRMGRTGNSDPT